MASYEEQKLAAIGLLSEGLSAKDVSRQLVIPYTQVLKWKPEVEFIETKEDVETVLDIDKVVLHELAETVRDKLEDVAEGAGDLVDGVLARIDTLTILEGNLQSSALGLIKKLDALVETIEHPEELLTLVEAIAKLQTAFFAKGANVNVLNMPAGQTSSKGISAFKSLERPQ